MCKRIKLIRDKVAEEIFTDKDPNRQIGYVPNGMLPVFLAAKLHEEVEEVIEAPEDLDEYADVLEVLLTMAALSGISLEDIEKRRLEKRDRKGGFEQQYLMKKFC